MWVHRKDGKFVRILEQGNETTYEDTDGDVATLDTAHFNQLYEEATGKHLDAALKAFSKPVTDAAKKEPVK